MILISVGSLMTLLLWDDGSLLKFSSKDCLMLG
jgi:hypothetical protein